MNKSELLTRMLITKKNRLTLQFLDKYCKTGGNLNKDEQQTIKQYYERAKTFR